MRHSPSFLRTRAATSSLGTSRLRAGTHSNPNSAPGGFPQNHRILFDPDHDPRTDRVTDLDYAAVDERKTTVLIDQDRVYSRQGFSERRYRWRRHLRTRRSSGSFIGRSTFGLLLAVEGCHRIYGRCTIWLAPALRRNGMRERLLGKPSRARRFV